MRVKRILFCFSLFVFHFSLFTYLNAQQKTWAVAMTPKVAVYSITQAKDKGYVVGGIYNMPPYPRDFTNMYVAKLDSSGNMLWGDYIGGPATYGGQTNSYGTSIIKTNDGGYVMLGYTDQFGAGGNDVYLAKLDSAGNLLWTKTIGGIQDDEGYSIIQTKDGGYAIAGSSSSYGLGFATSTYYFFYYTYDVYIIKTDSTGNPQWTKTIGGTGDDNGYSIIQTKDGGYAVTGETNSYGVGGYDVYVIKLDSTGNLQWTKTVGGTKNDIGYSIIQSRDGGYAVTGATFSFNDTLYGDLYLVKLDSAGNLKWTRTVGGVSPDAGQSIVQSDAGDYTIGGYTGSYGSVGANYYFTVFDSVGNLKQTRTFAGGDELQGKSMIQTKNGGFAMADYGTVLVLDSSGNNCEMSGSGGIIDSGGTVSSGGTITSSDSGRVNSGGIATSFGSITYLCSNNSGGLYIAPTTVNPSCHNFPNGSISLAVSGGMVPYTYSWSPNVSDSSSATGLSAGSYTITVSDSINNNTTITLILISTPLTFNDSVTNITCRGNANGSASVTITNGTSPYIYSWSNGATTAIDNGLSAGTYNVSMSDSCGNTATDTITVSQTSDLSDSAIVVSNISCNGESNGIATVSISVGTPPFTYLWSDANSQTTIYATGLSVGIYTISITDACGGSATSSVAITQPFAFTVNIASTTLACNGESNGSALASLTVPLIANYMADTVVQHFLVPASVNTVTLTIEGAKGGGPLGGNGANFIGISPVTPGHVLSIAVGQQGGFFDAGGAGGGASWVYDSIVVLYSPVGTTGLIAVAAGGGGEGYNGSGFGGGGAGGINLLTDSTTIGTGGNYPGGTGGNGGSSGFRGGGGAGWLSNGIAGGPDLGGNDEANHFAAVRGYISGSAGFGGGGSGGYGTNPGVAWLGGGGGGYNGGSGGAYGGGGGGGGSFFIDTLPIVTDSGTGNGFVRIEYTITGYDSTFTYSWSNGESTYTATGLSAGTYSLTVTNSSGCSATTSVTITQPISALTLSADSSKDNGTCNGSAWAVVNGGNSPYTYSWNPSGLATDTITNQCTGDYCCTVTDANGCMESVCVNIPVYTGENARPDGSVGREKVKVFPNPGSGVFTFQLPVIGIQHVVSIGVYNVLGEQVYSQFNINSSTFNIDLSSQPDGIYLYRVLTENGELVGQGKIVIEK